jgi:transglutaminase-like putative cysteine protease
MNSKRIRSEGLGTSLLWSVWTLAGISLSALLLTREMDAVTVLLVLSGFPLILYFEAGDRLIKVRWLENALILMLFAGAAAAFAFTKVSFLIAVADFLIGFILLKLLFRKDRQDLIQIVGLSFFLLLSASTLALDFTYLFTFMIYVLAAAWTLSLYTLAGTSEREPRAESSSERKLLFGSLARNCAITLGLVLLFAAGIFVFFPRLSLEVFQGSFLGPSQQSGIPDKMNLVKSGPLSQSPAVVARVEMSPEDRSKLGSVAYLRGQTLSFFDGTQWSASEDSGKPDVQDGSKSRILRIQKLSRNQFQILDPDRRRLMTHGLRLNADSFVKQRIYLEALDSPVLFALPWTDSIQARLPEVLVFSDGSVQRPPQFAGRIFYEARSIVERPPQNAEAPASAPSPEDLELPDLDFSRVRGLVKKIVSPKDPALVKARKIESYLSRSFRYDLNTRTKNARNPVEEFLFETKKGHCEYFASAMALMLRLENIPARIATGFALSEWNEDGHYFIVRSKDAHSWVEVKAGDLWLEFDPSPREGSPDLQAAGWMERWRRKVDYANFLWNAYVLSYDMESQKQVSRTLELKSSRFSRALEQRTGEWKILFWKNWVSKIRNRMDGSPDTPQGGTPSGSLAEKLILPGLLVLILAVWIKRRISPLSSIFLIDKRLKNERFYYEMLTILSKHRLKPKQGETPREFLSRFRKAPPPRLQSPEAAESMDSITRLFYKSRFSGQPMDPEERSQAQNALRKIRELS